MTQTWARRKGAVTQYPSHFRGPRPGGEMHIVLVANGRSERLGMAEFWTSLKCIRCGACMDTCPVYRRSGGLSSGQKSGRKQPRQTRRAWGQSLIRRRRTKLAATAVPMKSAVATIKHGESRPNSQTPCPAGLPLPRDLGADGAARSSSRGPMAPQRGAGIGSSR
jgi:ferredoxin